MDLSVKKSITRIFIIICISLLTFHLTIGVVSSESPLKVSIVDLYGSPPYSMNSRSATKIKVHVSSHGLSVSDADVSMFITTGGDNPRILDTTEGGTLSPTSGITDRKGDLEVSYTPPFVKSPSQIFISATATKIGYVEEQGEMEIQIQPSLDIAVIPELSIIKPGQKSKITVRVTIYGTEEPLSGAWVTLNSLNGGTFSLYDGSTDENGEFVTDYTAPNIEDGTDLVSISVDKLGYGDRTTSWISLKISEIALVAPILISPADGAVTDPKPVLKWGSISGAKSYEVFLGDIGSVSEPKDGFLTTSSNYTVQQTLTKDTYHWRVRAIDESGQIGPLSEIRSFTVESMPPSVNEFFLENTTFQGGEEVMVWANITPGNSPITSVKANIKKSDNTTDKLEMLLENGLYEGLYIAPKNPMDTPMEFEVVLTVEDIQGEMATSANLIKFKVLPPSKFNFTVRSSPEGIPTIPVSGIYEYTKGSTVSLSNNQNSSENFVFDQWLVDGVGDITNVTMDENHEAVAVFKIVGEEIEPIEEVVTPETTPPSEAKPVIVEPTITTAPPATEEPPMQVSPPSKVGFLSTSLGRLSLVAILLVAIVFALQRTSPELIKEKMRGISKRKVVPKAKPVEEEFKEAEEVPIKEEKEIAEKPEEIPVVEPEPFEIETIEEIVEEEFKEAEEELIKKEKEIAEKPEEIPVVEPEILELLGLIKDIQDSGEQAVLRPIFKEFLKKEPKKAMKDILALLDDAVATGLIKKDFLKNKEGIIEITYSLTDKGTEYTVSSP